MTPNNQKDDNRFYQIKIRGQIDDDFGASYCPSGTIIDREGEFIYLSNIETDQSGFLGLVRTLHNLGYTILETNSR